MIVVDGLGKSGACIADSGGPAVWREGPPTVVGILQHGDPSCVGVDSYLSIASLRDWIAETTGSQARPAADCGGITTHGACFDTASVKQAIWCREGQLVSTRCRDTEACGWDAVEGGFRCIAPHDDACNGVSQLGACGDRGTRRCLAGRIVERSCPACETCEVEPSSGAVDCVAAHP